MKGNLKKKDFILKKDFSQPVFLIMFILSLLIFYSKNSHAGASISHHLKNLNIKDFTSFTNERDKTENNENEDETLVRVTDQPNTVTLPKKLKKYQGGFRQVEVSEIQSIRLLDHSKEPELLLLGNISANIDFIKTVKDIIKQINAEEKKKIKILTLQSSAYGPVLDNDETRTTINRAELDQWLRDFGKIALAKMKGKNKEEFIVIDLNRGRELNGFSERLAKKIDIAYVKLPIDSIAGNYGGNIDVTPNGVLYIGDTAEDKLIDFFKEKGYENALTVLSTDWLLVGHVDEHISTIILPSRINARENACHFAIIAASTKLALKILKENYSDPNNKNNFDYFDNNKSGSFSDDIRMYGETLQYMQKVLNGDPVGHLQSFEGQKMLKYQGIVQDIIDENVKLLKESIQNKDPRCSDVELIEFPSLFKCNFYASNNPPSIKRCHAYLPGVVNMTVIGKNLLIPDPFYQPYKNDIEEKMKSHGQKVHFIEDMVYHSGIGEIHCGTNCIPSP